MLRGVCFTFILLISFSHVAFTQGKVDSVKLAMKKNCNKDVQNEEALRLVRTLYLSCIPGENIEVEGCKVTCLKENVGTILGR